MKSYLKIILILLFSVAVTILVSPLVAGILPFSLYRVMSRILLVTSFVSFYCFRGRLGFSGWRSMGLGGDRRWWGWLGGGFLLAVSSGGLIAVLMVANSIRFVVPATSVLAWSLDISKYILAGFIVAVIEECFFRGFIFQSLLRDSSVALSLLLTNVFYSGVHFLKPHSLPAVEVLNLASSIKGLPLFFQPLWQNWMELWPAFTGLFLVGMVLSLAYLRTRSLALSIGLHAGWIVAIKTTSLTTDVARLGSLWVNGEVIGHPLTWGVLILFIVVLGWRKNPEAKLT